MPVQLDIAGNFRQGQRSTLERRRGRQQERAIDYELAKEQEGMIGRRGQINLERGLEGMDPFDWDSEEWGLETNKDPMFQRLGDWWKERRASRVKPTRQPQSAYQAESAADRAIESGYEDEAGFRHGGLVNAGMGGAIAVHAPRRRSAIASAGTVPQKYADGGVVEEELARKNAAGRAQYETARAERALSPSQRAEARAARNPPASRGIVSRAGSGARRAVNAAGRVVAPIALGATAIQAGRTPTEDYRTRFGMEESSRDGIPRMIEDMGVRTLGAASDLGNALTFGAAGEMYRDKQEPAQEPAAAPVEEAIPTSPEELATPDQEVAREAITQGAAMADEAAEANKPSGAIDTSKVDFQAGDIPNMSVRDWQDYRSESVSNMMLQGMSAREAHAEISAMQQQGFIDYAQQSQQHLARGDATSAATAMRLAYQYFPNGSDIQLGVYQDPDTGEPSLIGRGSNEETGEPQGNPMILNAASIGAQIENFSDPNVFRAWQKDDRDHLLEISKEERELADSESTRQYQSQLGEAALMRGQADLDTAASRGVLGGRKQADLDRANAAFIESSGMLAVGDPERADNINAAMAAIYARMPDWQYPEVIDFINDADRAGQLDQVLVDLGMQ